MREENPGDLVCFSKKCCIFAERWRRRRSRSVPGQSADDSSARRVGRGQQQDADGGERQSDAGAPRRDAKDARLRCTGTLTDTFKEALSFGLLRPAAFRHPVVTSESPDAALLPSEPENPLALTRSLPLSVLYVVLDCICIDALHSNYGILCPDSKFFYPYKV